MDKVVFLSRRDAGRAQIARAYFTRLADARKAEAASAGIHPPDQVLRSVVEVLLEVGIDLRDEDPRALAPPLLAGASLVVVLGADFGPDVAARRVLRWDVPDPANADADGVRDIRNEIAARVETLVREEGWSKRTRGSTTPPPR